MACCQHLQHELQEKGLDHEETKENLSFALAAFIIWTISEIVIDLITGVTLAEMLSVKYIACYLAGALGFALMFTLIFKVLNLFPDKKKK